MTRLLVRRAPLVAFLACMLAPVAAAQPASPSEGDLPESGAFRPLWQDALPPERGPFASTRLPAVPALSLPGDAAWEGWLTPGVSQAYQHVIIEWQGKLVIAVAVYAAGHVACHNLVLWDGTAYEALPDAGYVQLVTTWNGDLVVAVSGPFPQYGYQSIKRFNGSTWDLLGVTNHYPSCMTEFDGKLVVGGQFTAVSGVSANHIAMYDGSSWSAMGSGLPGGSGPECLGVHGGDLFAGGWTLPGTAIVAWNRTLGIWEPRTGVVTGTPHALVSDGANLYAAGSSLVGGGVTLGALGWWDGVQWNGVPGAAGSTGWDATLWDGKVITTISSGTGRLSQWDGLSLSAVPGDSLGFGETTSSTVFRLCTWGTRLVASGRFINNGSARIANVAFFDGSLWSTASVPWDASMRSPNWRIDSMMEWNGKLVVAGAGGLVANQDHYVRATGAAVFDGYHWAPLSPNVILAQYRWLTTWNGDLVVGGYSLSIQGTPIQRMARWDGSNWHPLGTNAPDWVYAMQEFQGDLYVTEDAGAFNGLARWNGTTWQAVGTGFTAGVPWALGVHGDSLIVAGPFTHASGTPAAGIAIWDGATWHSLGAGFSGLVDAVGSWNGLIVAGGRFTASGAQPLDGAAYWDGSSWHQMGSNVSGIVYFGEYYGELFASGTFRLPDNSEVVTLAKWNGTDWHLLGSGTNNYSFAFYGDHLYGAGAGVVHGHVSHGLSRVPISAVLDAPRPQPRGSSVSLTASPNPARGRMQFAFTLPSAGRTRLSVLDVSGRVVATLVDGSLPAGDHQADWRSASAPGIYFARLEIPGGAQQVLRVARVE